MVVVALRAAGSWVGASFLGWVGVRVRGRGVRQFDPGGPATLADDLTRVAAAAEKSKAKAQLQPLLKGHGWVSAVGCLW